MWWLNPISTCEERKGSEVELSMQTIGKLGMRYFSRGAPKPKAFADDTDQRNGADHLDRSSRLEGSTEVHLSGLGWYFVPGVRNPVGVRDERDRPGNFARLANGRTSAGRSVHSGSLQGSEEQLKSGGHFREVAPVVVLVRVLQALIKVKDGPLILRCLIWRRLTGGLQIELNLGPMLLQGREQLRGR
jgi:hypothetical protein